MKNTVELIGYYGGDETHALSAWTSTSRDLTNDKKTRIPELLAMLAENGHHTPFEKSLLHFLLVVDTATHIHILKHRIGVSVNAESARYRELLADRALIPDDWPESLASLLQEHCDASYARYHAAVTELRRLGYDRKRAKESARFFLPYANQLTLDVSFNFRSFMHFVELRNAPEAQKEIRDVAAEMVRLVRETGKFNASLDAFGW